MQFFLYRRCRVDILHNVEKIKDLSKRLTFNTTASPTIAAYTIHNSHNGMICLSFSNDSKLMATGWDDSSIVLWDLMFGMGSDGFKALRPSTELAAMNLSDCSFYFFIFNLFLSIFVNSVANLSIAQEEKGTESRKLIGHSGPVYAVSFAPNCKALLSSSGDSTVRLWSLDTFCALVVYKAAAFGFPVWDVKYSPLGSYFVTASADKTARLYRTDVVKPLRLFVGHMSDVSVSSWNHFHLLYFLGRLLSSKW